ncbi:hypothetical protein Ga0609869_003375 [Rhodovulum iodosum]|uniref:CTP synthetase n=1 Tax=Rhodovulum iodosum TaxID=68291 RepID=A0ABV3XXD0_9RHOB
MPSVRAVFGISPGCVTFRLATLLFSMISSTLMGVGVVAVLVAGYGTLVPILAAAAVGFVLAVPVTWQVTRALY